MFKLWTDFEPELDGAVICWSSLIIFGAVGMACDGEGVGFCPEIDIYSVYSKCKGEYQHWKQTTVIKFHL